MKGFPLIIKGIRALLKSEDTTEEQTEEPEPPSTEDPEAEPMPGYWETDRNQEHIDQFREGKALERIPGTTEGTVKESLYKYANLPIYQWRDTTNFNFNSKGVLEPTKAGTGISSSGRDAGVVAGIVIAVISGIIILAALIAVVMYKHYVHRNVTSMNFDNPVYRKTTEDQFALEKNGYAPGSKLYPSTVGEEAQEPLNTPGTNDFV